jgi:hypothetical protein
VRSRSRSSTPRPSSTASGATRAPTSPASASSLLQQAEAGGGTCSDAHQGRLCQQTRVHEMYGTDSTDTYFVRGDLYVAVTQSNYPTNDLIGSILKHLES